MSFFGKLKNAISRITEIGTKQKDTLSAQLEDILIEADFGVHLAAEISSELRQEKEIIPALIRKLEAILSPLIVNFEIEKETKKPFVIVIAGVNGSGKTTTVAKLASFLKNRGYSVSIAACDTFRIAATEQLSVWAHKLGCPIFKAETPRDPASVAYTAMQQTESDVLIIDTAGRLHNNSNLMEEFGKICRCLKKIDDLAPHMNVLVIDSTTGQNAMDQVKEFSKIHQISGIIVSKMDGHAKGGTIVRISNEYKIPILGVGIGESEHDFEKFSVNKFLKDLMKEKVDV
jgi:fused signal recognition particle receptor